MTEPPKYVYNLLSRLCPDYLWEGIAGDLEEQFVDDVDRYGTKKARRNYFWNALRFLRPGILLRNNLKLNTNNTIMVSNYLKTARRNMVKRKLFTFINAFGLSIGLAFSILIYLFIKDENSFDLFHVNGDRIYRIEEFAYKAWNPDPNDPYMQSAYMQLGLAPVLKDELGEVEYATRFNEGYSKVIKIGEKVVGEDVGYADNDFFKMFSFEVISGNSDQFLTQKHHAVINEEIANKYFEADPIGQTIQIDIEGEKEFEVVGVIQNAPANSSLNYNILIPQENKSRYQQSMENWGNFSTPTFVQLRSGSDFEQFKINLQGIRDKYMEESMKRTQARYNIPENVIQFEYRTTNLKDIHLNHKVDWYKVSDPQYSIILGGLAILIICIASINYVSLALTTSALRKTEVGVRKSIGANRSQLIYQFSFESIILAFASMLLGILFMLICLPTFNEFTNKAIELNAVLIIELIGIGSIISLVIGIIAGSYPSLFLSSFNPALALKGGSSTKLKASVAKPLVLLQFTLSSILIISAFVMYEQMNYVTTKDLGFDKEQVLVVPTQMGWDSESDQAVERMRNALIADTDIISVAGVSNSFTQGWSRYGYTIDDDNKSAYVWSVDPYYLEALGIEIKEGRNFNSAIVSDTASLIINEALAKDMGWDSPLDEHLNWREDSVGPGYKIIGVVKDYHFRSLERSIEPMFLSIDRKEVGHLTDILIKLKSDDMSQSLSKIESTYREMVPDKPFEYSFLDQDVDAQYASFQRWMKIMTLATFFAILISGLGLFGLAGINAVNRTKEIGIRKVFGAPIINIFILLNRQFVTLALISFAFAAPLASYFMNNWWLSDFEFRVEMNWQLYVITFFLGLSIAILTVTYHGVKAAYSSPSKTLKYE